MKERIKKFIDKIVDLPKLVFRFWLILWATLFIFVIAKLCFNYWYPIVCENKIIVNICAFIDKQPILYYLWHLILYLVSVNIWILTCIRKIKYKKIWQITVLSIVIGFGHYIKTKNNILGSIIEMLYLIGFPIFINIKNKEFSKKIFNVLFPIIVYALFNLYTMNLAFIRGIRNNLTNMPTLIVSILQIDYYIFIIITWIGVCYFMGNVTGGWFWSQTTTQLLALKEAELKKDNPDTKLIADIDKELEKRNKK